MVQKSQEKSVVRNFWCILIVEYRRSNSPLAFLKYEIATFYPSITWYHWDIHFIHFGQLPVDPSAERLLLVRSIFFTYPHLAIVIDGHISEEKCVESKDCKLQKQVVGHNNRV